MSTASLPPEIRVEQLLPHGTRYVLPRRDLGGLRWLGLVPLLGGFGFTVFSATWVIGGLQLQNGVPSMATLVQGLFAIPFLIGGLSGLLIGLAMFVGHSRIEIDEARITWSECLGGLRWTRRRPIDRVRRFIVLSALNNSSARGDLSTPKVPDDSVLVRTAVIQMQLMRDRSRSLALGYPRDWLVPLSQLLAAQCNALAEPVAGEERVEVEALAPLPAVDPYAGDANACFAGSLPHRPTETKIEYESQSDGLTLRVPATGMWQGSQKFLFIFSLAWCGFMALFTTFSLIGMQAANQLDGLAPLIAFLSLFWLVGIALLLSAINMGRRRAALAVVGDRLMVLQTSIFRSKSAEWSADQLKNVRVGPSGMAINDVPVLELQILPKEGAKFGLLAGRDNDELEWMAARSSSSQ